MHRHIGNQYKGKKEKNIFSIHSIHVFRKLLAHLKELVTFTTIVISQKKSHKTNVSNNSGGLKCELHYATVILLHIYIYVMLYVKMTKVKRLAVSRVAVRTEFLIASLPTGMNIN